MFCQHKLNNFHPYYQLAILYEQTGDKANAEKYYKFVIKQRPFDPSLHHQYARFLWKDKRYSFAEKEFQEVIKLVKKDLKVHYEYALMLDGTSYL